jgi:hypothetical protein
MSFAPTVPAGRYLRLDSLFPMVRGTQALLAVWFLHSAAILEGTLPVWDLVLAPSGGSFVEINVRYNACRTENTPGARCICTRIYVAVVN